MTEPAVLVRATHPYGFRSGEWAWLTGVALVDGRPCFVVQFLDGVTDTWVVYDPAAPYEFRATRSDPDKSA